MRDESPYAVDWIAHHRAQGVTDFLVYTNDCSDGTEALLDALAPARVVHVPQGAVRGTEPAPQWRAMAAAWDHPLRTACDWAIHLDVDEYVCPVDEGGLPALIAGMPGADAIALPWRLFGSAGRMTASDAPVPERFRRAAPPAVAYPLLASFFKTLFQLDGPFECFGIHRPRQSAPPRFHDACGTERPDLAAAPGRIVDWTGGRPPQGRRAQLNHYSLRSVEEFLVKRERGLPNRAAKAVDLTYWVERNFNTVEDHAMDPHLAAMHREAASLRALPGVAEAEARGRRWHRERAAAILATEAGVTLAGRLLMTRTSAAPPAPQTRRLLELLRETAR
ncbi:glycosyltransferase family 2 protein [Jannaschia sp. W003]|uniref:glycosyltransferase family 2 protein n=1 Tax=Jannaschia sp. W003 TaxID=2867012 RepID=UPI0021A6091C|nr:glycosyltransferase family 2 protein [Jannaschia sp. W003]UWQ20368.1 glycosyltransferase family 2 protein [Jannaschia sp. W003]